MIASSTPAELDDNDRWWSTSTSRLKALRTTTWYGDPGLRLRRGPGYRGNTYFEQELADAEAIAREEQRGLWGACDT